MTEQTEATSSKAPAPRPGMCSIREIIETCGGVQAIADASLSGGGVAVTSEAVHKWKKSGIPDRHWWIVRRLCGVTAEELYRANVAARGDAA